MQAIWRNAQRQNRRHPAPQGLQLLLQHTTLNYPWRCASILVSTIAPCKSYFTVPAIGMVTSETGRYWTPGGSSHFNSRRLARAYLPVFKVRYIWESVPNTWKCPGTSQTMELTDIIPHYLSKVGAQFTNKTSHLTLCLLQNVIHLRPESRAFTPWKE